MTREEVTQMLGIMKCAYPNFYRDMPKEDIYNTINLWSTMFENEDSQIVVSAVNELINSFQYPPTIADIKNKMRSIANTDETPIMDYWNEFRRIVANANYFDLRTPFEKASEPVKRFIGSPDAILDYMQIDSEEFNTVVKGQFLKQVDVLVKREKEMQNMLPETKKFIEQLTNKMSVNKIESNRRYEIEYKQD